MFEQRLDLDMLPDIYSYMEICVVFKIINFDLVKVARMKAVFTLLYESEGF